MRVAKSLNVLPSHKSPQTLAEDFVKFFDDKVKLRRQNLDSIPPGELSSSISSDTPCQVTFGGFHPLTDDEVWAIISKNMASKTCSLDPIPTWMFKLCLDELLPVITRIVIYSLQSGIFPDSFKVVYPILSFYFVTPRHK